MWQVSVRHDVIMFCVGRTLLTLNFLTLSYHFRLNEIINLLGLWFVILYYSIPIHKLLIRSDFDSYGYRTCQLSLREKKYLWSNAVKYIGKPIDYYIDIKECNSSALNCIQTIKFHIRKFSYTFLNDNSCF